MPELENGLGITKLVAMVQEMSMKLWWIFRTKNSLWRKFKTFRYGCNVLHPSCAELMRSSSLTWRRTSVKDIVEPYIGVLIREGSASFWFGKWEDDNLVDADPIHDLALN
ncbi:hypothetical protein ACH5RR_012715 [Cinchona calisaya]|uniref:Uncharacterized protein n=1 Tax=Cinchona calisaya TaxID=153742 RepID=A0ABD3A8J6_9GENT